MYEKAGARQAQDGKGEMKKYNFYGNETADIKDRDGLTLRDCYDILSDIWCRETCAPRMRERWTKENMTLGQCSITAFLIQDRFGGIVRGVPLDDGNYHCFNEVGKYIFDLTSEQFGDRKLCYENCPVQSRDTHFAKEEKRKRYEYLCSMFERRAPQFRPMEKENIECYGRIYAAAFSGEPWNDPWKEEDAAVHVRELLESKQSYGLEYVISGKTVGFILGTSMMFHYGRTFEINDLAVDPEYQHRGIGGKLLEKCLSDLRERGYAGVHLITASAGDTGGGLLEFYKKHGFSEENRVTLMGLEL